MQDVQKILDWFNDIAYISVVIVGVCSSAYLWVSELWEYSDCLHQLLYI